MDKKKKSNLKHAKSDEKEKDSKKIKTNKNVKNVDNENNNKKNKKGKKKKHAKLKLFFKIFIALILLAIIACVAAVFAIFKTDKWAITEEQLLSESGAKLYDKDGNEILTLTGDEINKKVELSEMGKLPDAFVAIEDERFYSHKGVDVKRTAHAIIDFVFSGGNSNFGGSTITQQLVKITMQDDDRTGLAGVQRKIREWSRAYQLEQMLTKEQILQRYLNRIYLGSSGGLEVRGVESAANYYFNKSAKDLSVAQSAFIAGINHSPSNYNPFTSTTDITDKIKSRTLTVIEKMHSLGMISDDEYNAAVEETNNGISFEEGNVSNGKSELSFHAAAAINEIAKELSERDDIKYDEARELLINSGYSIYTTVDQSIQSKIESIYEDGKYQVDGTSPKDKNADHSGQSAMVIIEPSTGYVVGEVGGLGTDQNTLGLNRGLTSRQGGSAFKPLVTIAPALENKVITASTLFYDTRTTFGTKYTVSASHSKIENMRNILAFSCNVPEVKILSILGTAKSQEFLGSIGINVDGDSAGLSMSLGTVDVSPLQMAAGYAMIANKGEYIEPTFYTKVVDDKGNVIIETSQEKKRVMSEENAYIEQSLLTGPIKTSGGTASSYSGFLGSMDVAGKTGTTETAGDRWFCGMTPYYVAACWYGNDNNNGSFRGGNPAAKVWFNVMKTVHQDLETKTFEKPDGIVTLKICSDTGKKATDKCTNTYSEIFSKDSVPDDCDGHTSVTICKETEKLATEYCTDTETKTYGVVIDTEKNANWSPKISETEAPTETCDKHTSAPKITVPNVVGKSQAEATKELEKAGFKVKVSKSDDTSKAKGIVLKQSDTSAASGAEITITVNQYDGGKTENKTTEKGNTTNTNTTKPDTNTNKTNTTEVKNETTTNKTTE